ncbi:MAG: DNA repair protein RecN [Gammaproteobacteria bacterium]|nr:DNA repair protein RecN [Gammaproteobacteria bacterium]
MLSHLSVRHFALVDELEIDFSDGMSVVTGETGAGKSIILNALSMALGDRADQSLIASDSDRAEIHAVFDIKAGSAAALWLSERDLDVAEAILRRIINRDGRSRAFINGSPSTASDLKQLGQLVMDIHSQHEHQSLLRKASHLPLLDAFSGLQQEARAVRDAFETWSATASRLKALVEDSSEANAHRQLLNYQLAELQEADVTEGEQASLEADQRRLANAQNITQHLVTIDTLLDDTDHGAAHHIHAALRHLSDPVLIETKEAQELLDNAAIQLSEALSQLNQYRESVADDPRRLADVEARLSRLYELSRKHRIEPNDLPTLMTRIASELEALDSDDEAVAELAALSAKQEETLMGLARDLSDHRATAATALMNRVHEILVQLNMDNARLTIEQHHSHTVRDSGIDDLEFLIATSLNQTPGSLRRTASGGELSRISLAIQLAITETSGQHQTLVFDEVDVGVGGATADILGGLLRTLGQYQQILCVTHLPQVAAQGHHHLVVEKTNHKKGQLTSITSISETARVDELARMLAGQDLTHESRAHAEAMISAVAGKSDALTKSPHI